jgi:uncharacterized membrane protein YkvA (DUF1232 family)
MTRRTKQPKLARAARAGRVAAFVRYMRDADASTLGKLLVVAAAIYVVVPFDLIPDTIPVIGWLDDLGVATLALWYLSHALKPYREAPQLRTSPTS